MRRLGAAVAAIAAWAIAGVAQATPLHEKALLDFVSDQAALKYQVDRTRVDISWEGPSLTSLIAPTFNPGEEVTFGVMGQPRLLGRTVVPVVVSAQGNRTRTLYPRLAIKVWQDVWVTTKAIHRGVLFDPSQVKSDRRSLEAIMGTGPTSLGSLDGARVKREIPAGSVLVNEMFELPILVKSGSLVTVRLVNGDLTITTRGMVTTDAALGQLVRVVNPDTHKAFAARVKGPDRVEVVLEEMP